MSGEIVPAAWSEAEIRSKRPSQIRIIAAPLERALDVVELRVMEDTLRRILQRPEGVWHLRQYTTTWDADVRRAVVNLEWVDWIEEKRREQTEQILGVQSQDPDQGTIRASVGHN